MDLLNRDIAKELVEFVDCTETAKGEVSKVLEDLLDLGVMDRKTAERALAKRAYYKELKRNGNRARSAALQVAADYGLTVSFVQKSVYYYSGIRA